MKVAGPLDVVLGAAAEFGLVATGFRGPLEPPEISWAREAPIDGAIAEIVVKRTSASCAFP